MIAERRTRLLLLLYVTSLLVVVVLWLRNAATEQRINQNSITKSEGSVINAANALQVANNNNNKNQQQLQQQPPPKRPQKQLPKRVVVDLPDDGSFRNRRPCNERKRFVVLTTPRTGAHWLQELLILSGFSVQGELFLPLAFDQKLTLSHMKHLLQDFLNDETICFEGFVMMFDIVEAVPDILPHLKQLNFSIVNLRRRNTLSQMVSRSIEEYSAQNLPWHCFASQSCVERALSNLKINITEEIASQLHEMDREESAQKHLVEEKYQFPYIHLTYEKLMNNTRREVCRAISFLMDKIDIEQCMETVNLKVDPQLHKLHPAPMSNYISNWDQIVSLLKDTKFAWMLED
eukprot:TRINITY_DN10632_c0_g1_i1.p1 TRINITY_DN10632_c0_g1~~TRINITY_DN10632_c0_g1_i1.p1  ORF type:complete len:347 (-),score=77.61 TRINITY_DN10632_c0_g1_i1:154-1194(-)